jgi:uncharacterized membrane protein (DUF485 family)
MASITLDNIQHLPEYLALTRARRNITWSLSAMVILVYFALILLIAFAPLSLGQPLGTGVTSIGIVLGLAVILFCFLVTGFYVYYANHVLEPLARAVKEKAGERQ